MKLIMEILPHNVLVNSVIRDHNENNFFET